MTLDAKYPQNCSNIYSVFARYVAPVLSYKYNDSTYGYGLPRTITIKAIWTSYGLPSTRLGKLTFSSQAIWLAVLL